MPYPNSAYPGYQICLSLGCTVDAYMKTNAVDRSVLENGLIPAVRDELLHRARHNKPVYCDGVDNVNKRLFLHYIQWRRFRAGKNTPGTFNCNGITVACSVLLGQREVDKNPPLDKLFASPPYTRWKGKPMQEAALESSHNTPNAVVPVGTTVSETSQGPMQYPPKAIWRPRFSHMTLCPLGFKWRFADEAPRAVGRTVRRKRVQRLMDHDQPVLMSRVPATQHDPVKLIQSAENLRYRGTSKSTRRRWAKVIIGVQPYRKAARKLRLRDPDNAGKQKIYRFVRALTHAAKKR